jgi:integrase/recombinase XerD
VNRRHDWIPKNPARAVKAPKVTDKPTLPFSQAEMQRILKACDLYPANQHRLRAFVLVMRYSGLRIGDTISLNEARLRDSKLLLYTAKTGTPVYVPLPTVVMKPLVSWERIKADSTSQRATRSPRQRARTGRGILTPSSSW